MEENKQAKRVVALGKFDGIHIGHMRLLETAVQKAKELDALSQVFFIGSPRQFLADENTTMNIVKKIGIDLVVKQELTMEFMSMSAREFVGNFLCKKLGAVHVIAGYNFRFAKNRSAGALELERLCGENGIGCTIIPEVTVSEYNENCPVSSSVIRELVCKGEVQRIQRYLGRPYSVSGTVSCGRHLGTKMNFPTANILPPKSLVLLPSGVYITVTEIDEKEYFSVTNIGNNPTVSDDNAVTVETYIFDFSKDIYGKDITVHFLEKIRGEIKFSSLDELRKQIDRDKEYALSKRDKYIC